MNYCGACGTRLVTGARFCDGCGLDLGAGGDTRGYQGVGAAPEPGYWLPPGSAPQSQYLSRPARSGVRTPWLVLVGVVGVALALVAVVALPGMRGALPFTSRAWSEETQQNFMDACTFLGDRATCSCALEKLQNRYSEAEFERIETRARGFRGLPSEVTNIAAECARTARPRR